MTGMFDLCADHLTDRYGAADAIPQNKFFDIGDRVSLAFTTKVILLTATISTSLLASTNLHAEVIASDDFDSYEVGTRNLRDQPVAGLGFSGSWQGVIQYRNQGVDFSVFDDGTVGSIATDSPPGNAQAYAGLASTYSVQGQIFVKYDFIIKDNRGVGEATRLDLLLTDDFGYPPRAYLGAFTGQFVAGFSTENGTMFGDTVAHSNISTSGKTGTQTLVALFDAEFDQIAIWVNPQADDFYDPATGASSADGKATFDFAASSFSTVYGVGLIRNLNTAIGFDNLVIGTNANDIGLISVPSDSDGDGVSDDEDAFPDDPSEQSDWDDDGIGDNADLDDDNDGLSDEEEAELGTNPCAEDTDEDGVLDGDDLLPLNGEVSTLLEFADYLCSLVLNETLVEDGDWKNRNMRKPFCNKLAAVRRLIAMAEETTSSEDAKLLYSEAASKVDRDLIPKTDGYQEGGSPNSDWIVTETGQTIVYPDLAVLSEILWTLAE